MNLLLREAVTAAAPMKTGITPQSQAVAQGTAQAQQFQAASHPRGADGRFIQTGGTVQVLGGPDGKTPVAEGVATVIQGANGTMIQVKSPTTGQVITVPPADIQAAPIAEAMLGTKGAQGIPTGPGAAANAGKSDALAGTPPRSGKDVLGQQASPALMQAYVAAYQAEAAKVKAAAVKKAAAAQKSAAAKAKAAANKAKSASNKASALAIGPKSVSTRSARRYYK